MKKLNDKQLSRQDFVDNAIYELARKLNPSKKEIDWDIELIGGVRDALLLWLVERLSITDEMSFYPYIDTRTLTQMK